MGFFDIFKRQPKEQVGGMEDFMTLIRVYFQSVLAANLGISNLAALPDLATFKRTLHVATVNNKLGLGEKKACQKMLQNLYGISDNFFKEIDLSIKKGCKNQAHVQNYLYAFQGFSQELIMLLGNLLKWKFRIPGFLKGLMKKVINNTIDEIMTKNMWSDAGVQKSVFSVRRYQQQLGFSTEWIKEYTYNVITLAKKEPTPTKEEEAEAMKKLRK